MAQHGNRKKCDKSLVVALASGLTVRDAARQANIGERTAHRRLEDPAFQQLVERARDERFKRALGMLADGASEAVEKLRDLLEDGPPNVPLKAAQSLLLYGVRLREQIEIEHRVSSLEGRDHVA